MSHVGWCKIKWARKRWACFVSSLWWHASTRLKVCPRTWCECCDTALGTQNSAGANGRARQDVLRAWKEAPHQTLASRLMSATRGETLFFSLYKCVLKDRERSKHMSRYDRCGSNVTVTLGCNLTFIWLLAKWFSRCKMEHTVFSTECLSLRLVR